MTGSRVRPAFFVGLLLAILAVALQGVQGDEELDQVPSEVQCRPYIEKALKDLGTGSLEQSSAEVEGVADEEGDQESPTINEQSDEPANDDDQGTDEQPGDDDGQDSGEPEAEGTETADGDGDDGDNDEDDDGIETIEIISVETTEDQSDEKNESAEGGDNNENEEHADEESAESVENAENDDSKEGTAEEKDDSQEADDDASKETKTDESAEAKSTDQDDADSAEEAADDVKSDEDNDETAEDKEQSAEDADDSKPDEDDGSKEDDASGPKEEPDDDDGDNQADSKDAVSGEEAAGKSGEDKDADGPDDDDDSKEADKDESKEDDSVKKDDSEEDSSPKDDSKEDEQTIKDDDDVAAEVDSKEDDANSKEDTKEDTADSKSGEEEAEDEVKSRGRRETEDDSKEGEAYGADQDNVSGSGETEDGTDVQVEEEKEEDEPTPEEDLIQEIEIPENLRPRDHINQLLRLDEENEEKERAIQRAADIVLRDLKRLYDNAIKPLETLYKYRDLSNRHFGDPEIFSKPLVLFMGPWSGGKSSIINYLLDIEYKPTALRTGAEPSPAYFNILMHGEEEEVLDGTQLAADWTFSGLQKFGQGMLDRLRGLRLNNKLLEKVNIVEIPGILEIRKQVQRLFPFNDACQWFIDRADIIFLVYDPSKLDVGPETEAILDQLKGREYQTRIILNKADQVKPEELMRVQGALIWNISPLMSSAEPPIMYSTSLWSIPYEAGAPTRLLYAQERAFLRDLRSAIDKRVEHKIASARRFAVRVRNHAKMVDCYLTTYYNHKTFFGNKKEISDKIIENPQDYHIYEGLSTLTNISRYDLPDPDVYKDFFRLNPLYEFQQLSATCTYFRGCPINRLDVSIAYDLPELVGKYKKSVEAAIHEGETSTPPS
ncbi:sarcalumenin isoform X2 [Cephus cinctus]|uniref:Sarcalumenin isoform X2 n=1 Tax=Cephus cinctus TaxID=211228 RepID=A0AAJ7FNK9_CEPCN|nr:sarcalumenin isoform X2 [Cephus cinctus]